MIIYIHLLAEMPFYEAELAASDQTTGSHSQIFDWGGFAGSNGFVIYDDSDQIALAKGTRNWNNLAGGLAEDCSGRVFRAIGHYYLCGDCVV